jgi:phosphoribosylformylglycinamidine (FGAM) synthase-like amidotransferase family enzyme
MAASQEDLDTIDMEMNMNGIFEGMLEKAMKEGRLLSYYINREEPELCNVGYVLHYTPRHALFSNVDPDGNPSTEAAYNPNESILAIEGITSPDGRVFGRMAHTERTGRNLFRNVPGDYNQKIFEAGVAYFR